MWTNEEINRLKSQHGHGWSVEESADILERSPLDVRNKLIALGLKPIEETTPARSVKKSVRRPRITENAKNSIITMRDSGYALNDIVSNTGISLASVQRILRENGRTNPHKIPTIKPADTKLTEKCAELEKRILDAETVINNQARMIGDKNEKLYKALKEIEVLKASKSITEKYDNSWILTQVKEVMEMLKHTKNDNTGREIGYVIGCLDMLIKTTEKGLGF